jgi:hypothetical protein
MGLTGISEFTFGFAFLYEQTNRHFAGLTAVPILPSLQQEAGEGWDARLPISGVPNYYQFKLSDYLHRSNAKYIADGTYNAPYFRFSFHRKNNNEQHRRLRELSQTSPQTYYVAPEVDDVNIFNQAFLNAEIFEGSRIIPVSECQDFHDGEQHHITYQSGNTDWIEHSEPTKHESSFTGKEITKLYESQKQVMEPVNLEFAENLFEKQRVLTSKVLEKDRRFSEPDKIRLLERPLERTRTGFLKAASDQALTFFGATLVIIGESE